MAARGIAPEAGSQEPTAEAASTEQREQTEVVGAFQPQSLPLGTSFLQQSCTPNQTAHGLRTKCSNDDGVWYSKHLRGQDGGTVIIPVPEGLEVRRSGRSGLHGDCLKKQTWDPSHIHNNNNKLKRLTLPWCCEIQAYTEFFQSGAHTYTPTHLLSPG